MNLNNFIFNDGVKSSECGVHLIEPCLPIHGLVKSVSNFC